MSEPARQSGADLQQKHAAYLAGGQARNVAQQVVYEDGCCPHDGCAQPMQAIDFRLEEHATDVHDTLVRAWWADTGFVGRCPACRQWVHFTVREKRTVSDRQASTLPHLPQDWFKKATIL